MKNIVIILFCMCSVLSAFAQNEPALSKAKFLSVKASQMCEINHFSEAIRLSTEALKIRKKFCGKEHYDYVKTLVDLAKYNYFNGNYIEAIKLDTEALDIQEQLSGRNHQDYAEILSNLAVYFSSIGNNDEAINLESEALKVRENIYGKNHSEYALSLSNIAGYLSDMRKYDKAVKLETEALEIFKKVYGKNSIDCALSMYNLSYTSAHLGKYEDAIIFCGEALKIFEQECGKKSIYYAQSLHQFAILESLFFGYYADAITLVTEALGILKNIYGELHPYIIVGYEDLSNYCIKCGDIEGVEEYAAKVNELNAELIRNTFAGLTVRERQLYWDANKNWFENVVNEYAYKTASPKLISIGYNATLMAKGILLNSELEFSSLIAESKDAQATRAFNNLRTLRGKINRLYEQPIAERYIDVDSLEKVAEQLERELIERSKEYGDFTNNITIDWKKVQRKLGNKDVAIEFVSFPMDGGQEYAAYVMTRDMKAPRMVHVFDLEQLKNIPKTSYYDTIYLSWLVWGNLDEYIDGANNIYFAPTGELYNIAIESLPDPINGGLMSDNHKMYRLSSTRELAVIKDRNEIKRAALYGGLKYDTDVDMLEHDTERYATVNDREFSMANMTDSLNLRGGVSELPNTKIEVENISRSFKSTSVEPMLYTGTVGTEASFKALSGKKINIMHIATHGFYWTESEVRRSRNLGFLQIGDNSPRYVEDKALTRSGLLFTGANNVLTGKPVPDNVPDGVLTAKEISVLDLRGLDMVVLSACQTGLGEITGDGVFGLQRGFKKAGANTLLMSLWKVDDRATQMLMTKFYEHFLSGKTKLESLTLAQKYLREYEEDTDGEKIKPFEAPKYWAAFILLDAIN